MYKVFIKKDNRHRVLEIQSSAFLEDVSEWIQVDEGESVRFHHAQNHYLPQSLYTDEGVPRYKLVDGKVTERTAEEIQADIDAIPPPPPDPLQVTQKAATVMFRALAQTDVIKAEDALDNAGMFPLWADNIGQRADAGSYWRHGDKLYRVNAGQGHTIQADWAPDKAVSLFSLAANPAEEWPEYIPVTGAHNIYYKGAKVTYQGDRWILDAKTSSHAPGVVPGQWIKQP